MNIQQAKQIPIQQLLEQLGYLPTRKQRNDLWYLSPLREETTASFKVNTDKHVWYDHALGQGGDVINLVQLICRERAVAGALRRLDDIMRGVPIKVRRTPATVGRDDRSISITKVKPITSKALINYLSGRAIDVDIARQYVREVGYEVDGRPYFALGLANDGGGFELRNPNFKGSQGKKEITTIQGPAGQVLLFEGLFDFLTAATRFDGVLPGTAIILNSVAMKQKAVEVIRGIHPATVGVYRDNDAAGEELLAFVEGQLLELTVVDWAKLYEGNKDLNEWHIQSTTAMKRCP